MAGHAAGYRMDGKFDLRAVPLEDARKLRDVALCLGEGHAVAGHENDFFRGQKDFPGVFLGKAFGSRFGGFLSV